VSVADPHHATHQALHRTIEAVWRIESARVIAGLTRLTRDLDLAEDLAQEALVAVAGVNESLMVHDQRRTAAQRMLDAGIAVPRIMQICGWKSMSTFLHYAMTGRNVLRPELEKLVEFERKQRQGRQELVKQKGTENGEQTRALTGKDKLYLSRSRRKGVQSVTPSSRPASGGKS
jgi:hypothetical protein